jgi:hypothetical protein
MHRFCCLVLLLAILCCTGCPKPNLMRRYDGATAPIQLDDGACTHASAAAFVLSPIDESKPTRLANLDGRGQAALIEALRGYATKPDEFIALTGRALVSSPSGDTWADRTRFKRRIVFQLDTRPARVGGDANRIDEARTVLALPKDPGGNPNRAVFVDWSRIETRYETIERGRVKTAQESTLTASLEASGATAGIPATAGLEGARRDGMEEEVQFRDLVPRATPVLIASESGVQQRGAIGIDLTGNVTAEIELRMLGEMRRAVLLIPGLFAGGIAKQPNAVEIDFKVGRYAPSAEPLRANLHTSYVLREVLKNHETLQESDDRIRIATCEETIAGDPIEVVSAIELEFSTYQLQYDPPNGGAPLAGRRALAIGRVRGGGEAYLPLVMDLTTENAAYDLRSWLTATQSQSGMSMAQRPLYLCTIDNDGRCTEKQPLVKGDLAKLQIQKWTWNGDAQ